LDLLVKKPEPPPPDPDPDHPWSDDDWLAWAEQSYLPYRFWLEEIGELTGDITKYANAYADWLFKRYPEMRLSSNRMIYRALPSLKDHMLGTAPALILIVDNLMQNSERFDCYMQNEAFIARSPIFCVDASILYRGE
jgi:hypothetical protein